jgi:hypothetical protein
LAPAPRRRYDAFDQAAINAAASREESRPTGFGDI